MQTFMTHYDYKVIAKELDYKRLGKQRVEGMQTYNQITTGKGGFPHHPINMTVPAIGNMYLGPTRSRILPIIGAANPPTIPDNEKIAEVIAALPPKLCLKAGSYFLGENGRRRYGYCYNYL